MSNFNNEPFEPVNTTFDPNHTMTKGERESLLQDVLAFAKRYKSTDEFEKDWSVAFGDGETL